jgi:hypothetical protein
MGPQEVGVDGVYVVKETFAFVDLDGETRLVRRGEFLDASEGVEISLGDELGCSEPEVFVYVCAPRIGTGTVGFDSFSKGRGRQTRVSVSKEDFLPMRDKMVRVFDTNLENMEA